MLLVKNIGEIVGVDESGRLRVKGPRWRGRLLARSTTPGCCRGRSYRCIRQDGQDAGVAPDTEVVDAEGGMLFPSFCDSHTHLVYAGSREQEFMDKINGLSYEEIAARGGGILNSADRLHELEEELYSRQWNVCARLSQ